MTPEQRTCPTCDHPSNERVVHRSHGVARMQTNTCFDPFHDAEPPDEARDSALLDHESRFYTGKPPDQRSEIATRLREITERKLPSGYGQVYAVATDDVEFLLFLAAKIEDGEL